MNSLTPELLTIGLLQYVVFLLSTTFHEASHAFAAKLGGDLTAFHGGQVTLNPLPHIRREPFGMVVFPLLGLLLGCLFAAVPPTLRAVRLNPVDALRQE